MKNTKKNKMEQHFLRIIDIVNLHYRLHDIFTPQERI